jgi:hypothetical protein
VVNVKLNGALRRLAHYSELYRNNTLHYAVDIYVRRSACVFSIGMSLNRNRTIRGQTPDQMVLLSCKPKYAQSTYGRIPEDATQQTVRERIRLLKDARAFVAQTRLNADHLSLLRKLGRRSTAHPSVDGVWLFQPAKPHSYQIFSTLHNHRHQRHRPLTQKQRKTYQCQSFALEFAHHPNTLSKIF